MFSANTGSTAFGAKPASPFGSLGGSTQQQQPGAFGSAASNPNPSSGGLFGNTTASSQSPGGLFGALVAKPSGGLFGSSSAQQTTPGAFGASSNQQQPAGGLFGNSNPLNTALQPTTGGLFGASNNNQNQQGSGLFGASNNNQNQQGSGLFGGANNNQSQQGSGLFGGANNNQSQQGSGLFGAANNNQNQQGSGLFGGANNNQNQQGSGLFGGGQNSVGGFNKPTAQSSTTGGLFGSQQFQNQSQPLLQGGGLFGSSNAQQQSGGLFGASNNQQQPQNQQMPNSLFGSKNINSSQPSFAWTPANQQPPAGVTNPEQSAASSAPPYNLNNPYTPAINDQLTKIKQQWDPSSSLCALKSHLYNKLGDAEIAQLLAQPRPSDETPEDWEKALRDRPTANHYPVKVTSFSQVAQRIETELEYVAKSRTILNNLNDRIQLVASKHDLDTTTRISKARLKHVNLSRRLLRLGTVLAVIKLKGYPLLPEEEELSRQFNVLSARLNDPNSPLGKLNDVFARLAILKQRANDIHSQLDGAVTRLADSADFQTPLPNDGESRSDQIVQRLTKVLAQQQVGLVYLNNVLQKDVATVSRLETTSAL